MGNVKVTKEKIKAFWDKHKTKVIVGAVVVASGIVVKITNDRSFVNGAVNGLVAGFHGAIDWFDEEYPDLHLRERYDYYVKEHPDDIIYV